MASGNADSFITEDQVEEEVAHGLVGVPYHLAVVATRRSTVARLRRDVAKFATGYEIIDGW